MRVAVALVAFARLAASAPIGDDAPVALQAPPTQADSARLDLELAWLAEEEHMQVERIGPSRKAGCGRFNDLLRRHWQR